MRKSFHLVSVLTILGLAGCSSPSESAEGQNTTSGDANATGSNTAAATSGDSGTTTAAGDTTTTAGATTTAGMTSTIGSGGTSVAGTVTSSGDVASTGTTAGSSVGGATSTGDVASTAEATSSGGASTSGGTTTGGANKFIGNIAPKNQDVPADFADKWMQMSMEANSKWGFVQPNGPDDWVWEPVDAAYQYAKDHGIVFKQHNFFWNFEQPSWVTSSNVAEYGPKWIQAFCERYPDVPMIDVVNEPIHNKAPYREGMGGDGASGYDWVVQAYKWARQYCPNSILIINEFNIIEWENDHNLFITALHSMLDAGAPIDAIGAQGHDVYKAGTDVAKTYLDALYAEFGLPIYVTELDIDLTDDQEQLAKMQEEITMLWDHPAVPGITYWGFLQGSTWRTNAWLVTTSGSERPAMTWLQEFIAAHR